MHFTRCQIKDHPWLSLCRYVELQGSYFTQHSEHFPCDKWDLSFCGSWCGGSVLDRLAKDHVSIGWCTDRLGVPSGLSDGGRSTSLIMSLWENDRPLVIAT